MYMCVVLCVLFVVYVCRCGEYVLCAVYVVYVCGVVCVLFFDTPTASVTQGQAVAVAEWQNTG